jgi:hypothetical protein
MGARRESLEIGADLVGHVAARGDPIRAHDHQIDAPALHEMAAGVVDDDGVRHPVLAEFERGQRRALVARSRLVDEHVHRHAAVVGHVDRRRRGAPIDCPQPSGVAMGQDVDHASALAMERFDQRQAGFADATVEGDVLVAIGARARPRRLAAPLRSERRDRGADLVERVAQVDGGRPARQQRAIGALQRVVAPRTPERQRQAVSRGRADQRRAAHHHGLDRSDRPVEILDPLRREAMRQQRLVDHFDRRPVRRRPDRAIGAPVHLHRLDPRRPGAANPMRKNHAMFPGQRKR